MKSLLQKLLRNKVDCVLVGGLAATVYGVSTVTYDVDVCFDFTPENIRKLLEALQGIHPRVRAQAGWVALDDLPLNQLTALENLYLQTDEGSLDLLGSLHGVGDYSEVKKHSLEITVFDSACRILDLETLIQVKESLGRPKDRQVVLELKVIQEKQRS